MARMMDNETVLKAAQTVQNYCRVQPKCDGCIFHQNKIGCGCVLDDPNHLPETWDLGKTILDGFREGFKNLLEDD